MSQPATTNTANPEKVPYTEAKQPGGQSLVPGGQNPRPNPNRPPPVRGGTPFIVYDPSDFQDRSESTWAHCSSCNQIGMSVIKHEFSCRAFWGGMNSIERVHYCPFCNIELGRRNNSGCTMRYDLKNK